MTFEKISRRDAANAGRSVYFTGVECKRGHLAQRYTTTGACKVCSAQHTRKYIRDLNATKINESKGLLKKTFDIPKNAELEIVMLLNSVLIRDGFEPINKTDAQIKAEKDVLNPVIEQTPAQAREWAYNTWLHLHGRVMAGKFLAGYDAKMRGEVKAAPSLTHDGLEIEYNKMEFMRTDLKGV